MPRCFNHAGFPALLLLLVISCKPSQMNYLKNDRLKTIRKDYAGNPSNNGIFVNYEDVKLPSLGTVLKWQCSRNPQRDEKKKDLWLPEVVQNATMFTDTADKIVWMGHATFLITLNGKNILTDPVFNDIPFVKRLVGIPCKREEIRNIDYVLLSHGHFDHCDEKSFKTLAVQNPRMKVLAPLNMTSVLHSFNNDISVQEAGWYQQFSIDDETIEIFYMPAFHWYKRGLRDNNSILWGSFVIRCKGKTIFFMGDSGYNTHFSEISAYFPEIDYCIMGVGAYKPDYMMRLSHTSPVEAVKAFHDLKGKTFIPMHYGTYDLADEPVGEPLRELQIMKDNHSLNGTLLTPKIGEAILLK
jgi:L-ascorbate metabolism protein UlaG (beta-lactamase superfamily)